MKNIGKSHHNSINGVLENNNLLNYSQYANRINSSTEQALLNVTAKI